MDKLPNGKGMVRQTTKDWRRTVGMFQDDPVMKKVIEEALGLRDAERTAARDEQQDDATHSSE
jgi:hypothetical protein